MSIKRHEKYQSNACKAHVKPDFEMLLKWLELTLDQPELELNEVPSAEG